MTNYETLREMPLPAFAQWLCDINKCDTCWFKDKKSEYQLGKCTWYWLTEPSSFFGEAADEKSESHHSDA